MSILTALQAKVDAVDSDTSMSEILKLMYAVKDHPYKSVYDSAGVMPLDSASIGSIRYADNRNAMYMLVGIDSGWKLIDSDASTTAPVVFTIQGSSFGYIAGNHPGYGNTIDKWSFTSDGNASDVGDLNVGKRANSGGSSSTHGYASGGDTPTLTNTTEKISFASDGNASTTSMTLTVARRYANSESVGNGTHMYVHGGAVPGESNVIEKASLAAETAFTDVGDLTTPDYYVAGHSSSTHGYRSGGNPGVTGVVIDKYSFASDGNATDVGDLDAGATGAVSGQSSTTHGYNVGGVDNSSGPQTISTKISKFPFASDTNATVSANQPFPAQLQSGSQSTTHGYSVGGAPNGNQIQKFPFASDDNSSDVGDLQINRGSRNATAQV